MSSAEVSRRIVGRLEQTALPTRWPASAFLGVPRSMLDLDIVGLAPCAVVQIAYVAYMPEKCVPRLIS